MEKKPPVPTREPTQKYSFVSEEAGEEQEAGPPNHLSCPPADELHPGACVCARVVCSCRLPPLPELWRHQVCRRGVLGARGRCVDINSDSSGGRRRHVISPKACLG